MCGGQWDKNTFTVKDITMCDWVCRWGSCCAVFKQTNQLIMKLIYVTDPDCSQQTCSSLQTNTADPKQSTTLQNITSPMKAFSHILSCHDGGRPGGLHEYTHTLSPIIHWCMLQICKVGFIQAIRTFSISNKQKYTRSTHAVESIYSYIKK